jgi:hypothetical protein
MNPPAVIAPQPGQVALMKRIAEVATQSLGATQRRLLQYIDKIIPEQP